MNYQLAIQEASHFLQTGDKKTALEAFKNCVSGDKIKIGDLENAANQEIISELTLNLFLLNLDYPSAVACGALL